MQYDVDISGKYADLFLKAREIVLDFSEIHEVKNAKQNSYYDMYGSICFLRTTKKGLTFALANGATLSVKYPMLIGSQKIVRHLYFKELSEIDDKLIKEILQESLILNIEKDAIKEMKREKR